MHGFLNLSVEAWRSRSWDYRQCLRRAQHDGVEMIVGGQIKNRQARVTGGETWGVLVERNSRLNYEFGQCALSLKINTHHCIENALLGLYHFRLQLEVCD